MTILFYRWLFGSVLVLVLIFISIAISVFVPFHDLVCYFIPKHKAVTNIREVRPLVFCHSKLNPHHLQRFIQYLSEQVDGHLAQLKRTSKGQENWVKIFDLIWRTVGGQVLEDLFIQGWVALLEENLFQSCVDLGNLLSEEAPD